MSRLLLFRIRNFFVRKSTYIILLLSILVLFLIAYTYNILTPRIYGFLFLANSIWYTAMFFSSIIFVIIQVISIFKKAEDDGTSLFLLSKPISKFQQVLSQLIVLLISIIFFSLSIFIIGMTIGMIDSTTMKMELIKFASSVLIANIIIMSIFGSLVLLTSIWVSSRGMVAIWAIVIFFLPTFSASLETFTTIPFYQGRNYSFMPITKDIENSKNEMKPKFNENNIINFDYTGSQKDNAQKNAWNTYVDNGKNWTRWVDPYAQLNDLYHNFSNSNKNKSGGKWIKETAVATKGENDWILKSQNKDYLLLWKSDNGAVAGHGDSTKYDSKIFDKIMNNKTLLSSIKNKESIISGYEFGKQMFFANSIMDFMTSSVFDPNTVENAIFMTSAYEKDPIKYYTEDNTTWYSLAALYYWDSLSAIKMNLNTTIDMSKVIYSPSNEITGGEGVGQQLIFLEVGQKYSEFIEENLIPKIDLILIWLSIFVVATIVPSYLYIRKRN